MKKTTTKNEKNKMWGKLKLNFQPVKYENHLRKHCSNLQCFVRKYTTIILNQINIKKKSIKIILTDI